MSNKENKETNQSDIPFDERVKRARETLSKGFQIFSKKLVEGLEKTGEKFREIGQNVKIKIDERRLAMNSANKSNDQQSHLPEAYCGQCGEYLGPQLSKKLFTGEVIICEKCGCEMKWEKEIYGN